MRQMIQHFRMLGERTLEAVRTDALFGRLLRNSGWMLGSQGITVTCAFVQGVVVIRLLGAEQYGVWGIITACVSIAYQLTSFRIAEFVVKYLAMAIASRQFERAVAIVLASYFLSGISGLLAFGLMWWVAPTAAEWLTKDGKVARLFQLYTWSLVAGLGSEVSVGILQIYCHFRAISLWTVVRDLLVLCGVGIAAWFGGGLQEVILAALVGTAVYSAAVHAEAFRQLGQQFQRDWRWPRFGILRQDWREMGVFLVSTNLSATTSLLTKDSDNLWLGYFRNPTEVGYYKLAYSLAHLTFMPIKSLVQPTYAEIARGVAVGELSATRPLLKKASVLAATWVIPASVAVITGGPMLVRRLYGTEMLPAARALAILVVGLAFSNILYWNRPVLLAIGLTPFLMKIGFLVALLKLALLFVVVPAFGYLGNAALLTGLYLLGVSLCVWKAFYHLFRADTKERLENP